MNLLKLIAPARWLKQDSYDYEQTSYYRSLLTQFYQFVIPVHARILYLGCKTDAMTRVLKPAYLVALETKESITEFASRNYNDLFDYVIISSLVGYDDVQELLEKLSEVCTGETRVVITTHAFWSKPFVWLAQKLGRRQQKSVKNWLSLGDINTMLHLAGFEAVTQGRHILVPVYIPMISWLLNSLVSILPLINYFCMDQWVIARPLGKSPINNATVSVVIPCRNEKGNIEAAIKRIPHMGSGTELIFVEGHSRDGTLDELRRVVALYPERNIKFFIQEGVGKGDAVRLGFSKAQGDILMIQDADLTVEPEELTKFYDALVTNKAEFINGSRLVYSMESQAMRFLNLLANYFFGMLISWIIGQKVKDTLCGTKVVSKKNYDKIAYQRAFFGYSDPFGDFDLLFGAAKQQLKIVDLPIRYKNRNYGTTQISRFYHGFLLLRMSFLACLRLKFKLK